MLRSLLIFGALALLVASAIVEGVRSNRWGASEDLKASAAKLQNVPTAFGAWTSTENPVDAEILKKAEAVGSVSRVYENKNDRSQVGVLLLCGRSGPIGAHTPDICYAGLGFKMQGREVRKSLGDSSYWTGKFEKPNGDALMVSWAWGVDGNWVAAENPRVEFLGHDALYKLYATRGLSQSERSNSTAIELDATQEFLKEFLPEVKKALAPHGSP